MDSSPASFQTLSQDVLAQTLLGETIVPPEEGFAETLSAQEQLINSSDKLPTITIHGAEDEAAELRLLELLGQGGMGQVHLAHQSALGRDVAIKRLREERLEPAAISELLKEARIVGGLEHPNIIPIYALGVDQMGHPILVMKRVKGLVWKVLIETPDHPYWNTTNGDPLAFHLGVLRQVCFALECAHDRGILHRDLKADNVMIGDYGEVYLLDWGIAWPLGGPAPKHIAGTPGFMAPEMVELEVLTVQTDVYLLGSLLHELLTGQARHAADNIGASFLKSAASLPAEFGPTVPPELGDICNQATHRDPAERYPSVAAFREAIEAFIEHRSSMELTQIGHEEYDALAKLTRSSVGPMTEEQQSECRTLFAESQIAFRGALRMWEGNLKARQGYDKLLRQMALFELEQGYLEAARHCTQQLSRADEDLAGKIAQYERKAAQEQDHIQSLEALARNQDINVGTRARGLGFLAATLFMLFLVGVVLGTGKAIGQMLTYPLLIGVTTIMVLGRLLGILFVKRKSQHQLSSQIVQASLWVNVVFLALIIFGWLTAQPMRASMQYGILLVMTFSGTIATFIHPIYFGGTLIGALGFIGTLLTQIYYGECFLFTLVFQHMFLIWTEWRRWQPGQEA